MSKVVFVGNVPYNMSEDTLIDVFKKVGQVVGFRLVFDRETGKPRGYGFCEFADHETAQSAVRNLNNVDCGGRPLRIDLADSDPFLEGKTTMRGELIDAGGWRDRHRDGPPDRDRDSRFGRGSHGGGGGSGSGDSWLSNLPRGTPLPPGVNCMDAISQTVASIRPGQMMEILGSMKTFIMEQPDRAHTLLTAHPQLAYALFQALLVHQIVDPAILHRMIAATNSTAPATSASQAPGGALPPPPMHHAPPAHTHHPAPAPAMPPASALPPHLLPHTQYGHAPPPPPPAQQHPPHPSMYQTPPPPSAAHPHMGYPGAPPPPPPSAGGGSQPPQSYYHHPPQPPPASHPPPQAAQSSPSGPPGHGSTPGNDPVNAVPDAQRAMLMQMLQLTNEQVNALPPTERQAIQQLRNQFMALGSSIGS